MLIVGAPYFDYNYTDSGRAYVFLGSAAGLYADTGMDSRWGRTTTSISGAP